MAENKVVGLRDDLSDQEKKRAQFCVNQCPHPDKLCKRGYCDEFQKEFKLGKYSTRDRRSKTNVDKKSTRTN